MTRSLLKKVINSHFIFLKWRNSALLNGAVFHPLLIECRRSNSYSFRKNDDDFFGEDTAEEENEKEKAQPKRNLSISDVMYVDRSIEIESKNENFIPLSGYNVNGMDESSKTWYMRSRTKMKEFAKKGGLNKVQDINSVLSQYVPSTPIKHQSAPSIKLTNLTLNLERERMLKIIANAMKEHSIEGEVLSLRVLGSSNALGGNRSAIIICNNAEVAYKLRNVLEQMQQDFGWCVK
ncbi:hypothetical protein RFI_10052 [Reticulomyxa filosa]|uniref:Uncharacterized protein n=1 Tax=Reticulomyxa filosa TaxID=46433 RepID=X6NLB4_RETFI|nr:hypothetical protein RFI_10052 [Reticulomyxa filosa]|eukprot:ETO27080.1 hypothetical protein RFI_10052 [Reticulomyxa filosa]